ncbi:MAG: DUF86 domain-containing protein [Chloroflexi bacterium]|nr:DUF86 domain-containing protein [Chloroflexota bacterium]
MPPSESERLHHMLEAARDAVIFASGRLRLDLESDRMLAYALVRCIEIIGEAAAHVSESTRQRHQGIPWSQIRRMRNILSHVYFGIDHDIVWQTINEDLPPVIVALEQALGHTDVGPEEI